MDTEIGHERLRRGLLSFTVREALLLVMVLAIVAAICNQWTVIEPRVTFGVVSIDTPWRRPPTKSEAAIRMVFTSAGVLATSVLLRAATWKLWPRADSPS